MEVLIVTFLKDDHGDHILGMSYVVKRNEVDKGASVSFCNFKEIENFLVSNKLKTFNKVILCGHSQFYDEKLLPIELKYRTIGGYYLSEIIPYLNTLALKHNTYIFDLSSACESAVSIDTENLSNQSSEPVVKLQRVLSLKSLDYIKKYLEEGKDESISTVLYISYMISKKILKNSCKKHNGITVFGANGRGYIREGKLNLSFNIKDKDVRNTYEKYLLLYNNKNKDSKEIKKIIDRFDELVESNPGPHILKYKINFF